MHDAAAPEADEADTAASSLRRGSAYSFISQSAGNAGLLVSVLVISRALGPAGRGATAFCVTTAMITSRLLKLGVPNATTVFASKRPRERPELLTNITLFSLFSMSAGAVLVGALLLSVPALRPGLVTRGAIVAICVGTVGSGVMEGLYAFLLGCRRFRSVLLLAVGPWLYSLALLAVVAWGELTVTWAVALWAVSQLATALALLVASRRASRFGRWPRGLLAESLRFGVRAWAGNLAQFLNYRLDQWILVFMTDEATLGIYAVAVNVAEMLLYLPSAVGTALTPSIARAEPDVQAAVTLRSFRVLTVVTAAIMAVAALLGPFAIPLVFGSAFAGSVTPFLLLLPGAFGWAAVTLANSALLAASRPLLSSIGIAVALPAGIALDLLLIPVFGASGAAAASTVAFAVGGVVGLAVYRRVAPFPLAALVPGRGDVAAIRQLLRSPRRR